MKLLCGLCIAAVLTCTVSALDREAFAFTQYDLNATVDSSQQRLGVRGNVTLRNDSAVPQRTAVLQISSSLRWMSISVEHTPATFTSQSYTSDIDHTGGVSEAIISLPHSIAPKQLIELEFAYEGVVTQDATRLTRMGMPEAAAKHTDWDQIGRTFTALRGIGYAVWYPVATESASLSDSTAVAETIGRWKARESGAEMQVHFTQEGSAQNAAFYCSSGPASLKEPGGVGQCGFTSLGVQTPSFALLHLQSLDQENVSISFLPEHKAGADDYALAIQQVAPWLAAWLGDHRSAAHAKPQVIDLPGAGDAPFQSGNLLFIPLTGSDTSYLLAAVQQLTHAMVASEKRWIAGGLPLYAQARYMFDQNGPAAGIAYLQSHDRMLLEAEKRNLEAGADAARRFSLLNAYDEEYLNAKAARAWWMLHEIVGDTAFSAALHSYRPDQDVADSYVQKLMEAQSHRDLSWFLNDWIYQDKGLPDLKIASVFPNPATSGGYLVTVTVENLGGAAAEVPVTLKLDGGEATERLMVRGKGKASIRITAASTPLKAVVNDGSVPETDMSNNEYGIQLNH